MKLSGKYLGVSVIIENMEKCPGRKKKFQTHRWNSTLDGKIMEINFAMRYAHVIVAMCSSIIAV